MDRHMIYRQQIRTFFRKILNLLHKLRHERDSRGINLLSVSIQIHTGSLKNSGYLDNLTVKEANCIKF